MKSAFSDWPDKYKPEHSPVYSYNELEISADPMIIWAWLIRAQLWPNWYVNAKNVYIDSGPLLDLALGSVFSWNTFGIRVRTKVEIFEPMHRLAWSGARLGSSGYHCWIIEPRSGSCRVITEETQQGIIPSLGRWLLDRKSTR